MIATSWLYRILGGAMAVAALLWLIQSRDHWRDTARANEQLYLQEEAARRDGRQLSCGRRAGAARRRRKHRPRSGRAGRNQRKDQE